MVSLKKDGELNIRLIVYLCFFAIVLFLAIFFIIKGRIEAIVVMVVLLIPFLYLIEYIFIRSEKTDELKGIGIVSRADRRKFKELLDEEAMTGPEMMEKVDRSNMVAISAFTNILNQSFALYVDGKIVGYIGTAKMTHYLPKGTHDIFICTNTREKKQVYREMLHLDDKKVFLVSGSDGNYWLSVM